MVEFIKIITITGIMSIIAHLGGRRTDKYFMMAVGASHAGMLILNGCIGIANAVSSNPIVKGIKELINIIIGLGL